MSDIFFSQLSISRWRQFSRIEINFHNTLTILTGSNGTGKSTLLRLLAQHFGWNAIMLATPMVDKSGITKYLTRQSMMLSSNREDIGSIVYSNGHRTALWVPGESGIQYNVNFDAQASVDGINISSHRPMPIYSQVSNIPTNPMRPEAAYSNYFSEIIHRANGSHTGSSPIYRMKEAIISMATFGPGNENVAPNEELRAAFNGFVEVLRNVLPSSIGFRNIIVRLPDIVLETETGEFVLDASSGGMMSLIDLAWQIYLYSLSHNKYAVILDEPENHLHPSMQREVLGSLVRAFPTAQFVVATHSPFIVSSVRDSQVYVLRYDDEEVRSVSSLPLDRVDRAATPNEILRDVLGLPVTLPIWAEYELTTIVDRFAGEPIDRDLLKKLRNELEQAGLGEYYANALSRLTDYHD